MERIKEKLRRGKERLQGANGTNGARSTAVKESTPAMSVTTRPQDSASERTDSATDLASVQVIPPVTREAPDLWSWAAERLPDEDRV